MKVNSSGPADADIFFVGGKLNRLRCSRCKKFKPLTEFPPGKKSYKNRGGLDYYCHRCKWEVNKQYPNRPKTAAQKAANRTYGQDTWRRRREKLLALYGGFCECCGESRYEFLGIDHIEGGGKRHRKSFTSENAYYKWLLETRREGFRVLCHNCNFAGGHYSYCPHELEREWEAIYLRQVSE